MKRRLSTVFLLIFCIGLFTVTHAKDLLLHTIQYRLSPEKLLSMATVKFNNDQQPAFMILEPEIEGPKEKSSKQGPIVSQEQVEQQKKQRQAVIKTMAKAQFHTKLQHPIKVLIHNQDQIQQQCLFDQPWDLCMISNPQKKKSLDFSIHCLLQENSQGSKWGKCNGKITIRQSDLTSIVVSDGMYQQKVKYQSGLFELPQSERHSVMLVSCQDDDLPAFTDELKIFSNARYHRYERENEEEIKELVGFDRTLVGSRQSNSSQQSTNFQKISSESTSEPTKQTKERKFVYLDVPQQMVRKCLQFEFYGSSDLINERKVFDYVNLTDSSYKNQYQVLRKQLSDQSESKDSKQEEQAATEINKKKSSATQAPLTQPLFKYNPQLTLNIFKPSNQIITSYDIKLKLINPQNHTTIVSYTFPFNSQSATQLSTGLYAKSNHYHFCYVVDRELVEGLREVKVEVEFEAKNQKESKKETKLSNLGEQFFFMTLSVQDIQTVRVQRLTTTYLSVKKGSHITFLLQQPYQIDQIQTATKTHPTDLIQILPSHELQITLSQHSSDHQHTKECHFSQGCKFELDAVSDCLDCKIEFKTSFIKSPNDMLMLQIKETIFEGKIDLDEIQYFYKELKEMEVVQLIVNTPNIIIYTIENKEDLEKCKIPKKSCHSQIATSHERIVLSNPSKQQKQLIFFAIEGLDKTRFSLLLVTSEKLINLMNGIPFTYKLPDKKDQIELLFEVPGFDQSKTYQHNVTFNLISPLNSLEMDVVQVKEDGGELEHIDRIKTMAGFVKLFGKSVKARKIKVSLSKTTHYLSHSVHFTLIASTSDHKFRLDTGITHYQSLDSAQQKTFIIQFEDKHTYQLNLHLYDTPQKQISLTVSVFNPNEVSSPRAIKNPLNYKINSKQWVLVLDDELVDEWDLCPENDPECMLFVTVASMMAHEVEMAVTLMTQDSVLELKDGVWETFRVDDLLVRTHFYFTPTHSSNPVKIFFKSTNPQIFISARLYDNSQSINPAQWPFPYTHSDQQDFQMNENYMFKSNHLIQVDNEDEEFKKCFPHCVVLLSVMQSEQGKKQKKQAQSLNIEQSPKATSATLSILASNNHIQLPQKLRLTLELKPQQQQLIYIDLKHAFKQKKETLTFFTNMIVGYAQVYGKVYLPSLQNIPDEGDYDWVFGPIKTQVGLGEVRDVFMQGLAWMVDGLSVEEILQKQELYLALFIVAQQPTKLTLQYTTDYQQISELPIDSSQTVALEQNQQKLFQFYPVRDQKIRFIRNKGYPLFHQFKCQAEEGGFDGCLKGWLQRLKVRTEDDIRNIRKERQVEKQLLVDSPKITKDKTMLQMAALSQQQQQQFSQYQVLKKTQTQHVIECQRCIVFIWIYAMESSQLTIQLQSLSTETLLNQNQMLSDYVEPSEYHRYYLSKVQKEFTTVVVSVNEGSPVVTVRDNLNFDQTKKGSSIQDYGKKVLLFTVPPAKQIHDKNYQLQKSKSSFNTIFSNLHITITPQDSKPVSYTLSYSSGMHQTFLKNGVISSQYLFEKEIVTFYYKNQNKERRSYLTLTVEAPEEDIEKVLEGIEIKMFVLTIDAEKGIMSKDEIATQQPSTAGGKFKKHTTLTYEITPVNDLQIDIYSQTTTKITIGLSGGQLVFLPMDYEYPIHLQPKQQVKFLVQNLDPGQDIEFVLKKCDQSNPLIFYTFQEKEFENDRYGNYDKFGGDSVYRHVVRAEGKKGLYIKIRADPKQPSTLIIKSSYVFTNNQNNFVDLDPGNMGLVEYQFQSLSEIAVKFEGLQCGRQCAEVIEYYVVRGRTLDEVYREMVCAGEMVVKLFEKKQRKDDTKDGVSKANSKQKTLQLTNNNQQASSMLSPQDQSIKIQKIASELSSQSNTYHLTIPHHPYLPILSIKAIYKPTGQEIYYKPVEIKTLQSSVQSYSSRLVMIFAGAVVIGIVVIVVVTRNLARRGYVHVGQEETMVV